MIAVDAMGGDYAPYAIIEGAVGAARNAIPILLFGDTPRIIAVLQDIEPGWKKLPITVYHCSEVITMEDEPGSSVVKKKDSSLVQAILAVVRGQAQAVISAGNSGAALVAGILHFGKVPGILRPAIGGFIPTRTDSVYCLDLGANIDAKPDFLLQFAYMGDAYVRLIKNNTYPRIALLANGTESCKGTKLIQQAHQLLANSTLNFIGNCEPGDIFNDIADVVICEGFSGNIMLKAMESTLSVIVQWLKDEGNRSWWAHAVGMLGAPIFRRLKRNIHKVQRGGALLLGLSKPLIIAHGASKAQAIEDALVFANRVVNEQVHSHFNKLLAESLERSFAKKNDMTSTGIEI